MPEFIKFQNHGEPGALVQCTKEEKKHGHTKCA